MALIWKLAQTGFWTVQDVTGMVPELSGRRSTCLQLLPRDWLHDNGPDILP